MSEAETGTGALKVGVCGAGAWGTALALMAADRGEDVVLWARDGARIARTRRSDRLPDHAIPRHVRVTDDLEAMRDRDAVLLVVPSSVIGDFACVLGPMTKPGAVLVSCAKGLSDDARLLTDVLAQAVPDRLIAALSGPSFAADVAAGLPAAVALGCTDAHKARLLADRLGGPHFRIYPTDDLPGVEIGGAVKNVIAIACGTVAGLGLGDSAEAAIISRGFAEMTRLGAHFGARGETMSGLAGLGDLILTAKGEKSRNRRFGLALAQGSSVAEALATVGTVEGARTAPILQALAVREAIEMPITGAVADVVAGRADVEAVRARILARPVLGERLQLKPEDRP